MIAGLLVVLSCNLRSMKPPLKVRTTRTGAVIDVRTLGEYPSSVRRLRLSKLPAEEVVWELESEGRPPQLWEISLVIGRNPAQVEGALYGSYRVIKPTAVDFFELKGNQEYKVEVWGDGSRRALETFVLGAR